MPRLTPRLDKEPLVAGVIFAAKGIVAKPRQKKLQAALATAAVGIVEMTAGTAAQIGKGGPQRTAATGIFPFEELRDHNCVTPEQ
jgi:hypothetical protein